jgi:tetratricopeptide (TPR) repeat protein
LLSVLLASIVLGSLLAIGTVHLPSLIVVAALASAATIVAVRRGVPSLRALGLPVLCGVALTLYTALQAVPLPVRLLGRIAPSNADIWGRALLPFGAAGPSWAPISLDPGATLVEVLKWFIYTCVFVVATVVANRRGPVWGIGVIFASAVSGAVVTVAHGLLGASKVFGLYQPTFATVPWHVGPLLNTNNLAGYLNLGAMCGLGLIIMPRPPVSHWLIALGVAVLVGVEINSGSRGAIFVLPVGVLVMAVMAYRRGRRLGDKSMFLRPVGWLFCLALAGGIVLAVLSSTSETWAALTQKNLSKLQLMLWARPMIRDFPCFGIGRGAFETVFPAYRTDPGYVLYSHAENFPAQWLAEWGIPVGAMALAAFGWSFRPWAFDLRERSALTGAWCGVAVFLVQNLVDLALEVPGVTIAVAAALGTIWGGRVAARGRGGVSVRRSDGRARTYAWAIGVASASAVVAAIVWGRHDALTDREKLYAQLSASNVTQSAQAREAMRGALRSAMLRHPAEPYFSLLGALVAWQAKDANPMPWLERTLERSNMNGPAHLLLAQILVAKGAKAQALLELRLAAQDDPRLVQNAMTLATKLSQDYDDLASAAPPGVAGSYALHVLATNLVGPDLRPLRIRLEREALARDPNADWSHLALARDLMQDAANATGPCASDGGRSCRDEVEAHARALDRILPQGAAADFVRAEMLAAEGQAAKGEALLAARCTVVANKVDCLQGRVGIANASGERERLDRAVKDLVIAACGTSAACADIETSMGDLYTERGDWAMALVHYDRAAHEVPTEARWLKAATAAERTGAFVRASEALQRVSQLRGHSDPALKERIAELRSRATPALYAP